MTTGDPRTNGTFKVTTLRNVATTGPFTHNGYFRTLDQVVDFYATRDVKVACTDALTTVDDAEAMGCWPAAEVPGTLNHYEAGNLTISTQDRADIVSFLTTLTDGYTVPEPASLGLSLIGLAALCCGRQRRHRN